MRLGNDRVARLGITASYARATGKVSKRLAHRRDAIDSNLLPDDYVPA
jgi:hypothetical protein